MLPHRQKADARNLSSERVLSDRRRDGTGEGDLQEPASVHYSMT
jgi:hypothetical protein